MSHLTKDEKIFLSRTAAVMIEKPELTIEEAMRAVLARDEGIWLSVATKTNEGKVIADEMSADVYRRLRAA